MRLLRKALAFLRRNQQLLTVLAVLVTMVGLGVASGHWLFFRASYLLLGLIFLSFVWARASWWGLKVVVQRSGDRLQVGQHIEARLRLRNAMWFPKLWLEAEDPSDMPGRPARRVFSLAANEMRNWRLSAACLRRGVFSVGPLQITSGDPFGLFRFRRRFGQAQSVLVYPLPEDLPFFWAPPAQLPGEGRLRQRTHYVTPYAASVRDYQPGDSFNRIHWRSTARHNRLMVKTFELDPSSDVWVVLDLERGVQAGSGDDSTEEYGVRVAASIAHHFLAMNRSLGFIAYGERLEVLEPSRGSPHYLHLLEALALASAQGEVPLAGVLAEEAKRFGRHSTVVVITPSADESWVEAVQLLLQGGARVAVVLLEPSSFGARQSALLAYSTLVASDILTYLVRCGDDLTVALGPAGAAGQLDPQERMRMR